MYIDPTKPTGSAKPSTPAASESPSELKKEAAKTTTASRRIIQQLKTKIEKPHAYSQAPIKSKENDKTSRLFNKVGT